MSYCGLACPVIRSVNQNRRHSLDRSTIDALTLVLAALLLVLLLALAGCAAEERDCDGEIWLAQTLGDCRGAAWLEHYQQAGDAGSDIIPRRRGSQGRQNLAE